MIITACSIEVPGGAGATNLEHAAEPTLISTEEIPEVLEPGSRLVTEAEVRAATGVERGGWLEAARREYQESFMDMNAVARATPQTLQEPAAGARPYR